MPPQEKITKLDNDGNIRVHNRAARRHKMTRARTVIIDYVSVLENMYTKATHKIKKMRKKNDQTKSQRQRAIAKARKARKAYYSQIS